MFVQQGPWECGYQLTRATLEQCPLGQIRVVRYGPSFDPVNGRGYYTDFYLREMIRNWKRKRRLYTEKRMALLACARIPNWTPDTTSYVCSFF
jgi:hypothetical protein